MKYTIETVTTKDKRRALYLAYQVMSDKRNLGKFGGLSLVKDNEPDLFTYADALEVIKVMFEENSEKWLN